jgi:Domain of unknown function (DUF4337)
VPTQPRQLDTLAAITAVIAVAILTVVQIKAGSVSSEALSAQGEMINNFNWFQARQIRQLVADATAVQLELAAREASPALRATLEAKARKFAVIAMQQNARKGEQRDNGAAAEARFKRLSAQSAQFDLAQAILTVSVAMFALVALTDKLWLYFFALVALSAGVVLGALAFLGG